MARQKTATAGVWHPEIIRELDKMFGDKPDKHEIPLGDIEPLGDLITLNRNADLGICLHGVQDHHDCIDCRTNGCSGGADCACASKGRRRS